jgi:hypothetical protein
MQKIRIEPSVYAGFLDIFVNDEFFANYGNEKFSFAPDSDLIELDTLKEIIKQLGD